MDETFGGGFTSDGQPMETEDSNVDARQGVLPVLIRQLLLAEDHMCLFGYQFAMTSVVAVVTRVDYSATKITYSLEDFTGRIDAHLWIDSDKETAEAEQPEVKMDHYYRVCGAVRNTGGVKHIVVYNIQPIRSPNETTTHWLEAINARYTVESYKNRGGGAMGGQFAFTDGAAAPANPAPAGAGGAAAATARNVVVNPYGLDGILASLYNDINMTIGEEGISREQLAARYSKLPAEELDKHVNYMVTEGMIYTTIDADHFKCVE